MFSYWLALAPVLKDLAARGVRVDSIAAARCDRALFRTALPALIDWFRKTSNPDLKVELAGALATPWAKPSGAKALIEGFRGVEDESVRWSIGNALSDVATDAEFDAIVELVEDSRYGRSRERLAGALGSMKDPRAVDVLIKLLGDADVVGHAVIALGKLRARRARQQLETLLRHEQASVRRAAKAALGRMT